MTVKLNIVVALWCKNASVSDEQILNAVKANVGQCTKGTKTERVSGERIARDGTFNATLSESTALSLDSGRARPIAQLTVINRALNGLQSQLGYTPSMDCPQPIADWLASIASKKSAKAKGKKP